MANIFTSKIFKRNLLKLKDITLPSKTHTCASIILLKLDHNNNPWYKSSQIKSLQYAPISQIRLYSDKSKCDEDEKIKKMTIFQKFKQMYKDYWYVLLPVHLVTSAAWFGGFYYLAKSGIDIPALLESMHISEKITSSLKDSQMGYLAVSYALYKIATPARYTVTLGGTTISINYLKKWGYIKPVPSTERLKEIYQEKKDNWLESMRDTRDGLKMQSEKLKDKKENIIDDFDESIKRIKDLGSNIKSKEHDVLGEVKKKSDKSGKD